MARNIRLVSPLDPIALANSLKKEMSGGWSDREKRQGRVMGWGTESEMRLHVAHKGGWIPRIELRADMQAHDGGTLITGRFGKVWRLGYARWSILVLLGYFLFTGALMQSSEDAPVWVRAAVIAVPAMLIFLVIFWRRGGKFDLHEEGTRILDFLREHVQAREDA